MADKELVKSEFDRDLDDTIDSVMQVMMIAMVVIVMIPMLPVAQSAQQYFQSQQYEGQQDSRTLLATSESQHVVLPNPWVGAFFINDGPDTVEIRINDEESLPYILNLNETRTVGRVGADNRIYAIYYNCYHGRTATIRADGVY